MATEVEEMEAGLRHDQFVRDLRDALRYAIETNGFAECLHCPHGEGMHSLAGKCLGRDCTCVGFKSKAEDVLARADTWLASLL